MKRRRARVVIAVALAIPLGASVAESKQAEPTKFEPDSCEQRLQAGLEKLVDLPPSLWRFVILEEPKTGRFIQFAWWDGIGVDLPLAALDAVQKERAAGEFAALGAATPERVQELDGSMGEEFAYQFDFGRDVAAAARFGCGALLRIHALPGGTPLKVTVDGD